MRKATAILMVLTAGLAGSCATPARAPAKRAAAATPRPASPPLVTMVCADLSFPIYFETSSDRLTAAAGMVIAESAERLRGCQVSRVDVVGLADADGSANRNLALSRRRAGTVAQALAAAGLPRPAFDIDAVGAVGAVTPDGRPEPLRRRTEVIIRAAPPLPATASPAPAKPTTRP